MPTSVLIAVGASFIGEAVAGAIFAEAVLGGMMSSVALGLASSAIGFGVSAVANAALRDDESGNDLGQANALTQTIRDKNITLRQPLAAWRVIYGQARVGGVLTYAQLTDDKLHLVITFAGHVCQSIDTIYFNDVALTLDGNGDETGQYAGYVRVKTSLGTESGQPFSDLATESGGDWSSLHMQKGRTKIYVRLTANADLFPTGLPNITAVIKGKKVYDPRLGSPGTTAYSRNPSLCIADYLCDANYGLGCVYADEIDEAQLIASANIDDELVTLSASPTATQIRYTMDGFFDTDASPRDILEKMLSANAGRLTYIGGLWQVRSGAYATPTVTLDEDDLRGVPRVSPRLSGAELGNGVKGVYIDVGQQWQPTDYPPVTNAAYLAEDNGERRWLDLSLPFTKTAARAQRIAKIALEQMRQQITVQWPGKLTAYKVQPGDTVMVTFAMLGWSAKVFEVLESAIVFEDDGAGGMRLGCDLTLRETVSTVYQWLSDDTEVDDAPDTSLPDPFTVNPPSGLSFDEESYQLRGEGYLRWTASTSSFTSTYQAEYRVSGTSTWIVLPPIRDTQKRVTGLVPDDYDFRVKAISDIGVSSTYVTISAQALGQPPVPRVTGLELFNAATGSEFTDRAAMFVWRAGSQQDSYNIGSEPLGAGSGARDPYFKDYLVVIYNADGSVRRTEPENAVLQPRYTYTYENNTADGEGTPAREFTIKVWQRGRQNQLSSVPAQLTVSNPQVGQPLSVQFRSLFSALQVEWVPPATTPDVQGAVIHVSTSNGFTPSAATVRYRGPDHLVTIDNVAPATTYYMKLALFDLFDEDDPSYTTQLSVTTPQINTADIANQAVSTAKIALDAVTTDLIAASAITATELATDAVTADKIIANAVTTAKLNANAVTAAKIAALTITAAEIAAGTITAAKLVAGTITAASGVIGDLTADVITAGTLNVDRINALAIVTSKLNYNAVNGLAYLLSGNWGDATPIYDINGNAVNVQQITIPFAEDGSPNSAIVQRTVWMEIDRASGGGYLTVYPSTDPIGAMRIYTSTTKTVYCLVFYERYLGPGAYGITITGDSAINWRLYCIWQYALFIKR